MKNYFHSIWFKVVHAFFWIMVFTFLNVGLMFHILNTNGILKYLPIPLSGLPFLSILGLLSVILGSLVSMFAMKHVIRPINELSEAMQQVAKGDYTVRLNLPECKRPQMDEIYNLHKDFNQMVQQLSSTETLHSDFIANVSHEFKTPLAAISGYATLLQDDTLTPEERDEYIEIIIRSAKELSRMTGNILSLSRLENQSIISEKEYFRVDEQIRQIILRMEPVWSEKNIDIDPELEPISWYGNQELASHIWTNLLDNAVKFTPQGGMINITARAYDSWLTVTFQDTGIGMSPEVQAHIFDKFYQGDTSHKKKGNGLGLALVRQIVTLHGGSIDLESTPELGSTFKILLPMESSLSSSHTSL